MGCGKIVNTPHTSLISSSTGLSSSRLCLDDMEKTSMKALPIEERLSVTEDYQRGRKVTFRDGEPLHCRKLMAASSVRDLHGAHSVVAADHFSEQEVR